MADHVQKISSLLIKQTSPQPTPIKRPLSQSKSSKIQKSVRARKLSKSAHTNIDKSASGAIKGAKDSSIRSKKSQPRIESKEQHMHRQVEAKLLSRCQFLEHLRKQNQDMLQNSQINPHKTAETLATISAGLEAASVSNDIQTILDEKHRQQTEQITPDDMVLDGLDHVHQHLGASDLAMGAGMVADNTEHRMSDLAMGLNESSRAPHLTSDLAMELGESSGSLPHVSNDLAMGLNTASNHVSHRTGDLAMGDDSTPGRQSHFTGDLAMDLDAYSRQINQALGRSMPDLAMDGPGHNIWGTQDFVTDDISMEDEVSAIYRDEAEPLVFKPSPFVMWLRKCLAWWKNFWKILTKPIYLPGMGSKTSGPKKTKATKRSHRHNPHPWNGQVAKTYKRDAFFHDKLKAEKGQDMFRPELSDTEYESDHLQWKTPWIDLEDDDVDPRTKRSQYEAFLEKQFAEPSMFQHTLIIQFTTMQTEFMKLSKYLQQVMQRFQVLTMVLDHITGESYSFLDAFYDISHEWVSGFDEEEGQAATKHILEKSFASKLKDIDARHKKEQEALIQFMDYYADTKHMVYQLPDTYKKGILSWMKQAKQALNHPNFDKLCQELSEILKHHDQMVTFFENKEYLEKHVA